jgi:GTP pyrophosphokinase
VTSPTQSPSREWINMVATSRAKHKIRHWLNTEQKHRSIELGRKLIEREAKRYKVQWRKLVAENALDGVLSEHGLPRLDDLMPTPARGRRAQHVERFVTDEQKERDRRPSSRRIQQAVRKIFLLVIGDDQGQRLRRPLTLPSPNAATLPASRSSAT